MSMVDSEWGSALTRPSSTASSAAIMLGVWVITLTVINLVSGAYSPGFKVLWIGFISGEHGTSNIAHEGVSVVLDDVVFGLLGIVLLALGSMGMSKAVEGGIAAWAGGIPQGPVVSSLFSSEGGTSRTLASWLVLLGLTFYLYWNMFVQIAWVDPGVYAVMVVFVSFGFGIHTMADAES